MKENKSKKDLIKNFAIIFLAVLLVLTFFSNTIQNYSLPEVSAQYCYSGSITNKVRGTGIVEAADPYDVVAKETRKIDSVSVKEGDEVEKGQVIYVLEEGGSDELKEAEETLESLKNAYSKALVTGQISTAVSSAVEAGNVSSASEMQGKIDSYQNKIDSYEAQIESLNKQISLWQSGSASDLTERKTLQDAKNKLSEWTEQDALNQASVTIKSNELTAVTEEYEEEAEKFDAAKTALEAATNAYNEYSKANKVSPEDDATLADLLKTKEDAQKAYDTAKEALDKIAEAKKEYDYANTCKANSEYQIVQAQYAVNAAKKAIDDKVEDLNYQLSVATSNLETVRNDLSDYVSKASTQMDLSEQLEAIKKQQEAVDKLKETASGNEVVAPVSGTILSLSRRAGETFENGETVATIKVAGKGYTLTMSVTKEQSVLVSVGDEAEIINSWWYSDVQARVIGIKADKDNPTTNKVIVFELEGDVTNGQQLSLTVGKRTANYDNIVPTSAIREDNKGKFVYRIKSKSSPLGNRYYAERVDVKVLAEDDTETAISGDLESWEYILVNSSKPVEDGQLIRLKDN